MCVIKLAWASSNPHSMKRMFVQRPWVISPSLQKRLARQSIKRLSGRNSPIPSKGNSHWIHTLSSTVRWYQIILLTSMIPSIQLSAIQPKGPLMLASDATGAKKLANLILLEHKFYIFQNRNSFHDYWLLCPQVRSVFGHCHEGGGAHAVARVEHLLLPGGLQHVLQHGGQVVARHLVPGEVPEPAACLVRVQEGVVPA